MQRTTSARIHTVVKLFSYVSIANGSGVNEMNLAVANVFFTTRCAPPVSHCHRGCVAITLGSRVTVSSLTSRDKIQSGATTIVVTARPDITRK